MIDKVINVNIMKEPANWVLIPLMAYAFAMTLDFLTKDA